MPSCLCIGGLVIAADAAAWVLSAQTGDSRWVVLITSGTAIIVALCTMFVMVAPHVGKAITSLGMSILPALAAIRKQNEELNKGSLSAQIEELRKSLEDKADDLADTQRKAALDLREANEKATAALAEVHRKAAEERAEIDQKHTESLDALRKNLHAIRNEFQNATLQHAEQRAVLIAQVTALTKSLDEARQEIAEFQRREHARLNIVDAGQARQDVQIQENKVAADENTAAIQDLIAGKSGEMPVVKVDEPTNSDNP